MDERDPSNQELEETKNVGPLSRWNAVTIFLIENNGDNFAETFGLAFGTALQIVEYIKAAEYLNGRVASRHDIAAVSGLSGTSVSTTVNKLIKKQIITKVWEGRRMGYIPHPRLFASGDSHGRDGAGEPVFEDTGERMVVHISTSGGVSRREYLHSDKKDLAQPVSSMQYPPMQHVLDHFVAMKEEICERLPYDSKRGETVVLAQVLDFAVALGEANEWTSPAALARLAGRTESWVSRIGSQLFDLNILERQVQKDGRKKALFRLRLSPAFIDAIKARAQSRLQSSSAVDMSPKAASEPSSNALSSQDSLSS